jgi:hypothetical protein
MLRYTYIARFVSFLRNTFTYRSSYVVGLLDPNIIHACCGAAVKGRYDLGLRGTWGHGLMLEALCKGYMLVSVLKLLVRSTTSQTCHLEDDDTGVVLSRVELIGATLFNVNTNLVSKRCNALQRSGSNLFLDTTCLTDFYDFLQSSRLMPK